MDKPDNRPILVTGGAGFIGRHLVELLVRQGRRVRVVDLKPEPRGLSGVEYFQAELGDGAGLRDLLAGIRIIYHLAWSRIPAEADLDPAGDVSGNVISSIRLFQAAAAAGVAKVVFLSSGGTVYGVARWLPIPEDHPPAPVGVYGINNMVVEKYLEFFRINTGLDYIILRGANLYGEGQDLARPVGAVGNFLNRLLHDDPISIWGDGRVVRDFLYVGDLVRALYLALSYKPAPEDFRTFNVGTGQGRSLLNILEIMQTVTGRTPRLNFLPPRVMDVPKNVLDCRRIAETMGWRPQVEFQEGVGKTWEWLQRGQ